MKTTEGLCVGCATADLFYNFYFKEAGSKEAFSRKRMREPFQTILKLDGWGKERAAHRSEDFRTNECISQLKNSFLKCVINFKNLDIH